MPKVRCLTLKTENDYSVPPLPHCIERDAFLPLSTRNFGSQDYWMKQPKRPWCTPRHYNSGWKNCNHPGQARPVLPAGGLCVRVEESMEPLTSFTDEEVLTNDPL